MYVIRLDKIQKHVRSAWRQCAGFAFDSGENMTVFQGFHPGSPVCFDLAPVEKSALIPSQMTVPPHDLVENLETVQDIVNQAAESRARHSASTQRGGKSLELVKMLAHQLRFLYDGSLDDCASMEPWYHSVGVPFLQQRKKVVGGRTPSMLCLTSDQGGDIVMGVQAMKWIGIRCFWTPDHNHRDHNDLKACGAPLLLPIEVLGRCVIGPYNLGLWHRAISSASEHLLENEAALDE